MPWLRAWAIVMIASWWSCRLFAQDAQPSLAETLAWMDSTYNPHDKAGGAWGHGREEIFSDGKPFRRRASSFTYNGCEITLQQQGDPAAPLYSELYTSSTFRFNLRHIDPKSVKLYFFDPRYGGLSCDFDLGNMVCSIAEMEFETRNQQPLMDEDLHLVWPKLSGSEHEARKSTKSFVGSFYIDDAEYAKRFAKAFTHAVTLCGGTPSPF